MSEVITIGEPIVTFCSKEPDVSMADALEWHKILGGAELNVAIGVKRLGHSVEYISRVGEDPFGEYTKRRLPVIRSVPATFLLTPTTGPVIS